MTHLHGDDLSPLRREVLELGGSTAAMSGCLSPGDNSAEAATSASLDTDGELANVDGIDGSVVKTDHLLTDPRNADVVVWQDERAGIDVPGSSNVVRQNFGYQTEASGTYTTSGRAAYSYEIPHDLEASAVIADVWAESADAAGSFYVSGKDADSITVTYRNAPLRGSNNLPGAIR